MDNSPQSERSEPAQPAAGQADIGPAQPGRRSFLMWVSAAVATVVGVLLAVPVVRYVLYPIYARGEAASWSKLGPTSDYASIKAPISRDLHLTQIDGWRESVSTKAVYVTTGNRPGSLNGVEALTAICPHLGCEVPWNAEAGRFECPCHGSVFAKDGALIHGPALRGMDTLPLQTEQGNLMTKYEYFQALLPYKKQVD